tara:strand:+ start:787 stop:1386 length:600 start_codon:yes stop_codon:yes gene_type:complete
MNKLFNNHYNLFITISAVTILGIGVWYMTLFTTLKTENNKLAKDLKSQKSKSTQAEKTFNDLATVKREWSDYNLDFEEKINRIPDISDQKRIFNVIFDIIKKSEIKVDSWSPSKFPVEEKTIFIPDTNEEIMISKYPIDIQIICTFPDFGILLEKLRSEDTRLSVSNVNIIEKGGTERQTISFIIYTYFQTALTLKVVN